MKIPEDKFVDTFDYDYLTTASAGDCTGLIPAAPPTPDAWDSYADIYPFLPIVPLGENPGDQLQEQLHGYNPEKYY